MTTNKKRALYKELRGIQPQKMYQNIYKPTRKLNLEIIQWNADTVRVSAVYQKPDTYNVRVSDSNGAPIMLFRGLRAYKLFKYGKEHLSKLK